MKMLLWASSSLMLAGADLAVNKKVRLESLQVLAGKGVNPYAKIRLMIDSESFEAESAGNGPLDASIKALKKITFFG